MAQPGPPEGATRPGIRSLHAEWYRALEALDVLCGGVAEWYGEEQGALPTLAELREMCGLVRLLLHAMMERFPSTTREAILLEHDALKALHLLEWVYTARAKEETA